MYLCKYNGYIYVCTYVSIMGTFMSVPM
jgi:hypothetical protein